MKYPSVQTILEVLSERTPVVLDGMKIVFCKATLVAARGGKLVYYTDVSDTVVHTEQYSRSSFYRRARKSEKKTEKKEKTKKTVKKNKIVIKE